MRRMVHLITPGDHYSPRTGSAIPTVVHGLSAFRPAGRPRPAVLVAAGTYADRYDSAEIIEYPAPPPPAAPATVRRYADPLLGLCGLPRPFVRRPLAAAIDAFPGLDADVLLAHNSPQAVPLMRAAGYAGVVYAHNLLFRTYTVREAGRVLDGVAAIVCVSNFLAEDAAARLPRRIADRLTVVHNGVDLRLFRPGARAGDRPTLEVLFVGRMTPEKGADVLVEALRLLGRRDIALTLVGSSGFDANAPLTAYEQELRRSAEALVGGVRHLPFSERPTVAALMAAADVVVVPSRCPEAFALTALEGMAAGAAVVASDVGGVAESVEGVGMLVRPDDPEQLAEAIDALAADRTLLGVTAAAGRAYAQAHDWSWASARLDEVLDSVL